MNEPLPTEVQFKAIEHGSDDYRATVALREAVLRKPQGLAFSEQELNAESVSCHLVCKSGGELMACVVLQPLPGHVIQLRQMAVASNIRGQRIGSRLMAFAERYAKQLGCQQIRLHARTSAEGFYTALGYRMTGQPFKAVGLSHRMMEKELNAGLDKNLPCCCTE